MRRRAQIRASRCERYWHVILCAVAAAGILGLADFVYLRNFGEAPSLGDIWWLVILAPLVCGSMVTLGCGGATLGKRTAAAAACGVLIGVLYTAVSAILSHNSTIVASCVWRIFIFTILSTVGAVLTEITLPEKR